MVIILSSLNGEIGRGDAEICVISIDVIAPSMVSWTRARRPPRSPIGHLTECPLRQNHKIECLPHGRQNHKIESPPLGWIDVIIEDKCRK